MTGLQSGRDRKPSLRLRARRTLDMAQKKAGPVFDDAQIVRRRAPRFDCALPHVAAGQKDLHTTMGNSS